MNHDNLTIQRRVLARSTRLAGAVCVTPGVFAGWAGDSPRYTDIDYDLAREQTITRIMLGVRPAQKEEAVEAAIAGVLGAKVSGHVKPALRGSKKKGNADVIFLECEHPCWLVELRPMIPKLTAALSALGFKEVRLR